MKIQCEYCGSFIDDTDEKCPNCGGVNSHLKRSANGVPRTIEELKKWCVQMNIPLEQARFFIGTDYRGARAFGIYQDINTGNFIVYKNKSDGTRAVRYEGKDEAYAVNEIYQKLRSEMLNQKLKLEQSRSGNKQSYPSYHNSGKKRTLSSLFPFFIIVCVATIILITTIIGSGPRRGYYEYGSQTYYYQPNDGWYLYNGGNWSSTYADDALTDHYGDYYSSGSYDSDYDASDFTYSGYYEETESSSSSDSDWDSGWDSSDSWDSGSTDWDSDW